MCPECGKPLGDAAGTTQAQATVALGDTGKTPTRIGKKVLDCLELSDGQPLQELMRTAMEELPWVPLYYEDTLYVVDRRFEFRPRNDLQVRAADIRPRS